MLQKAVQLERNVKLDENTEADEKKRALFPFAAAADNQLLLSFYSSFFICIKACKCKHELGGTAFLKQGIGITFTDARKQRDCLSTHKPA